VCQNGERYRLPVIIVFRWGRSATGKTHVQGWTGFWEPGRVAVGAGGTRFDGDVTWRWEQGHGAGLSPIYGAGLSPIYQVNCRGFTGWVGLSGIKAFVITG
jgi:hypothetical protein